VGCGADHFLGGVEVAVVVDANLGDDERRITVADESVTKFYFTSDLFSCDMECRSSTSALRE
jgi:hypothetical protein